MTKLPESKKFIDFSDYARPLAVRLVKLLLPSRIGAYTLTFSFLFVGLFAAYLIYLNSYPILIFFLLLLKSLLDAADGEIARQRNQPSMVGRYMDSIFDFIVNLAIFVSLMLLFNQSIITMSLSLLFFQLQGSVFNYYYLVKRYQVDGDKTSRIFEQEDPIPFKRDNISLLKIFHKLYLLIYGWQDYIIYKLDPKAVESRELPAWYLSCVSFFGLGFQLLIIGMMVIINIQQHILFFFAVPYTLFAVLVIVVRKLFVK